jgi:iron complex outermembrane recepter protein
MQKLLQILAVICCFSFAATAQDRTVTGMVSDKEGAVIGANVRAKSGTANTSTDANGKFSLRVPASVTALIVSYIGSETQEVAIPASGVVEVMLVEGAGSLGEVVVSVGSRNAQRTVTDAPVPVDIIGAKDLRSTGQATFDKALQYRVPSFNTVNTPVNDATTLLDPYEIRNMGPSRTLILVNGKRKNLSSLLYVQFSPGRGETGVDLSAIPQEAIERVEILRDGASAQYGSDAIAGVMNVILKSKYDFSSLNVNTGITSKGDGKSYGVALNSGHSSDKGFINYTVGLSQQGNAVRSGNIHVPTEIATFGLDDDGKEIPAQVNLIKAYLKDFPTGGNLNGTAEVSALKLLLNGGVNFGEKGQLYANGAIVKKKALSNANFRTPYWRQDRGLLHSTADNGGKNYITKETLAFSSDEVDLYKGYIGYMPTFEGDLTDYNATIGAKDEINGWKTDVSLTTGGNSQLYTVNNTVNRSLGKASPTSFKPGGFSFNHIVGNLDVSKNLTDKISLSLGAEARSETYKIMAGDTASFVGQGSNSFPGINSINAATNSRFNIGMYADLSYDITENFLVDVAGRTEKYSDFGNANVWKLSSRYKLADDKVVLRASYSTGFRAPTLHQIYSQSVQASFAGGTIVSSGLFNNNSKEARLLGVPKLKAEKSTNIAVGVGFNPTKNLSITVDYYNIGVKDRIVYSSSITTNDRKEENPVTDLGKILKGNAVGKGKFDLNSVQFFINGIKTVTSGLDVVVSQRNLELGSGKLAVNLAGNYVISNEIIGSPNEPEAIRKAGASILNEQIKSLLTESRPQYKAILGLDYQMGKLNVNLNNTLFGKTAFRDFDNGGGIMADIKAEFKPAVVTDLSVGYNFTKNVALTLNVNNIFNILPKWDLVASSVATTDADKTASAARAKKVLDNADEKALLRGFLGFSGRYDILGYNGSQFSQLGTMFNANLNIKF